MLSDMGEGNYDCESRARQLGIESLDSLRSKLNDLLEQRQTSIFECSNLLESILGLLEELQTPRLNRRKGC
ncbi:ANE_G0040450.mRNA.1.CDS.1 [Saccharomyces cerevisiae]|nr:ANE_G0040450.mRNA.1.CDS.1 [Saccharomyces cerevisiae]CAI6834195.1 ANE_G0040450.mRNA.1.CDS.1 [Saccharomyces cerevisiae]